jgi:hypothetical protein
MAVVVDPKRLPMWVIYDHPKDWPKFYVARLHYSLPQPEPTGSIILIRDLEELRDWMQERGYICMPRDESDDPVIIETWMC